MFIGTSSSSLAGSGSTSAGGTNSSGRSLRNDLLVAADSVTNAMSTLVRELNSGTLSEQPELIESLEVSFQHNYFYIHAKSQWR
jgi:hypothetical protein